ncbi:hypothetical protein QN277_025399 [Acacia crassicarpa]|uniref:CCHC-type domain-containing protein n=1 Tax=Acacia crassicarpa TaxID=499986 RepID=A0AAE1MGF5_9FABA|nr:hypothetical protein QN277_025399 [Acacia crassicarpa]
MDEPQISTPLVWREVESPRILIGKFLANKSYTRLTMESILGKVWNLQAGFEVMEITGNSFLFKFVDEEDYFRVLRGRPWSINGCLLNLLERSKYKAYDEFDFSRCPVWIQMHNVPLEALCLENAITIGRHVGEVLLAEDPNYNGRYLRNFLCARVLLDLRKPLAYGFWLPRPDGRKIWIAIRYEKLQTFCYNCGLVGHDNRNCKSIKLMSASSPSEPRYGAWITTTVGKHWEETLTVLAKDEAEAGFVHRRKEEALKKKTKEEQRKSDRVIPNLEEDIFSIRMRDLKSGGRGGATTEEGIGVNNGGVFAAASGTQDVQNEDIEVTVVAARKLEAVAKNNLQTHGVPPHSNEGGSEMSFNSTSILDKTIPTGLADLTSPEDRNNSRAMVVYCENEFKEMLSGLGNLGLKRSAEEDWISGVRKKKKVGSNEAGRLLDITNYANNLKKEKARLRRSERKKKLSMRVNVAPDENESPDRIMEDNSTYEFVFKARKGSGKRALADGNGGWPLTATKPL